MQQTSDPQILVEQISPSHSPEPGHWLVGWRIQNLSQEPLEILAARLPHSQFRSEERELSIPKLLPNESAELKLSVRCNEPPGTVVENAFLILRVLWSKDTWRIFARLRVVIDGQGGPQSITEVVTSQRVGFSARGRRA